MPTKQPEVLVVHCVDTEGPIGGDVRRRPDGSAEFMDSWPKIERSIRRLTRLNFRKQGADSFDTPYRYNWFIMDFTGFRTNPKRRVAKYHDTYDHFKALSTKPDGFYWHYHHPPASGIGDAWSGDWNSSNEYENILLRRLVEREDFPEAYRAGGTIEDNAASHWLEDHIMIDYSNRVSSVTKPTKNINDFNWHGAPSAWGFYHPSKRNLLTKGSMRRYIVRSVDLWSRLHVLTVDEVREAFALAGRKKGPVILSYFSHDHREMLDETLYAISLLNQVAKETGIPWRTSLALEALQHAAGLTPTRISVTVKKRADTVEFRCNKPIYQKLPFVGAELADKTVVWLEVTAADDQTFSVVPPAGARKVIFGATSLSGNKVVCKA